MGPNGTYLHTSIPGTGIYSRKKIGSTPNTPYDNPHPPKKNGGCFCFFVWCFLLFCVWMICMTIPTIRDTKNSIALKTEQLSSFATDSSDTAVSQVEIAKTNRTENADEDGNSEINQLDDDLLTLREDLKVRTSMLTLFVILLLLCLICLIQYYSPKSNKSSQKNNKTAGSQADNIASNMIQHIKDIASSTNDPLKKQIINNYLGHLINEDAEERLKPLVEKWRNKVERKSTPQKEEQLKEYEEQFISAKKEASGLLLDVDSELSDLEKKNYQVFCDAFQAFKNCRKTWAILSRSRNTELKSSAYTTIQKAQVVLKTGFFPFLTSSFDVPVLPASTKSWLYFYPRFIIHGDSLEDFDVYPLDKVTFRYKPTRFIENGPRPMDSKQVDTTYMYVNKNGEPDRRYAHNPMMPVMLYGDITILPFGDAYQVSNCETAMQLDLAFQVLREGYMAIHGEQSDDIPSNPISAGAVVEEDQGIDLSQFDDRLEEAARMVVMTQKGSITDLQRKLGMGYAKAGRVMDQLESLGIVGPQYGDKPRQVLIANFDELDRLLRALMKTPAKGEINEQYFYDVLDAVKRLLEFGDKLAKNQGFCNLIGDTITGEINWNGKVLTDSKDKIPAYLCADVFHCYTGLGHSFELSSNEGLGLVLFNTLMAKRDTPMDYTFWCFAKDKLTESFETFTRKTAATMRGNEGLFLLETCLKGYDNQLHNQYVVLLYRFASLVAKADKSISTTEADWLNKIMSLKEPEGEKDLIAPINPDEKPQVKTATRKPRSNAMKELNSLIGLDSVKSEINTMINYIKVQRMRAEKGMKVSPVSYHCVFTGNPGTGKTTVARIVSEVYKELGVLKKGHLVETDRSGLVAEYVGQTAVKTNKSIDSALDGILFIDEAYSLVDGGNSDYGKEAIATLLKRMEDDRDRLVVILAGYTDDMKRFIDSNPGLQSRFNRYIEFPDYSAEELYQIFESCTKKYEYKLTEGASSALKVILEKAVEGKDKSFGNGRFVRNLFEKVIEKQANRISSVADITAESLATIEEEDIRYSL